MPAADSPVLGLTFSQNDRDVVSWDTERDKPTDDLGVEVPLCLCGSTSEAVDRYEGVQLWFRQIRRMGEPVGLVRDQPQTNGKVERFNRALATEWAYADTYLSDAARAATYQAWLHHYKHRSLQTPPDPYTGIGGKSPVEHLPSASEIGNQDVANEPTCRLRLDGCTGVSTTADHIIPRSQRPELTLTRANLQGACRRCNSKRGNNPIQANTRPRALSFFDTKHDAPQHDSDVGESHCTTT